MSFEKFSVEFREKRHSRTLQIRQHITNSMNICSDLSIRISIYVSQFVHIYKLTYLSINLYIYISAYFSVSVSIYLSIYLSINLFF